MHSQNFNGRWRAVPAGACLLLAAGAYLHSSLPLRAQTWDGGAGTGVWATANNWNPNSVPGSGANLTFNAASANSQWTITLGNTSRTVGSMTFTNAGGANGFTFNAGTATLTISGTGITNNDTDTQTFNVPITVSAVQTWNAASGGLTFNNTVTLSRNLTLSGSSNIALTGTLINSGGNRAITNNNTAGVTINNINLSNNNTGRTLTLSGTGNTTVSGVIANGGTGAGNLSKTGTGTVTLSGANTYTGTTTVSTGILNLQNSNALGSGTIGATVASGATLQLQGAIDITGQTLTISGTGVGGIGALNNVSGNNSWQGADINLNANSSIVASAGQLTIGDGTSFADSLNLGTRTLTLSGAGNIWVNSSITGTGSVIKSGTGTLTYYANSNAYTGTTTINEGTLVVDVLAGSNQGINGGLVIGDGVGVADSAVVQLGQGATPSASEVISNTAAVTIRSDGLFNLNDQVETIGPLSMTGGHVSTGANGLLYLNGNVTGNASSSMAVIDGVISLNSTTRTFTIASGTASPADMTINAIVQQGSLVKAGAGRLALTGANTYTGTTTVSAGVLNISNNSALGDVASGTTVNSGAALEIQGGISVGAESLTLNGTGISSGGALRNVSGNNSWAGAVTLGSASRINSDAGTLTLNGGISGTNQNLTIGGGGNTALAGALGLGSGSLTKDGSGTLSLSGSNVYTGGTAINAGVINISNNYALGGPSAGNTTVASGAALQMQGGISVGAQPLTLNGTGIANDGALRNVSGNNSWAGAVTLGSTSRINSDAGTLTLAGGITGTNRNLTIGGAGNVQVTGAITTGTGSLTKDGGGTLTLASGSTSTYTGATNINAGTLQLGSSNQLADTTAVTVANGATLNLNNYSDTIGSLAGGGVITLGSGTLTVGANNASTTFSGSFTAGDTGAFAKTGTGTLTFGSGMDLSSGTLVLSGGTLNLGGFNSTFGSLSVTANSVIDFGASGSSILNILSSVSVNAGVTLTITNWADTVDYFYSTNNPGSAILGRIVFNPPTYTGADTKWQSWDTQITPIPEPADYGALLTGLSVALALWRRHRRTGPPAGALS
ncbi:MAG: autotransporter-associated beta strand repeat-containing protein [Opitutaceae bacterium]|nr:autotransporter-associated beta strand repeat-containing protein [Opitutaceae bacterium]